MDAAPFRVHSDLRAIEAAMKTRRYEACSVAYRTLGRGGQQGDKLLLLRRLDREDVYDCDGVLTHRLLAPNAALERLAHGTTNKGDSPASPLQARVVRGGARRNSTATYFSVAVNGKN